MVEDGTKTDTLFDKDVKEFAYNNETCFLINLHKSQDYFFQLDIHVINLDMKRKRIEVF